MIKQVIIKNYKSIKDVNLSLNPINILIGANGAGKSNFIHFFKLINHIYTQNLQSFLGGNFDAFLHFGQKFSQSLEGTLVFDANAIYFKITPKALSNTGIIEELSDYFNTKNQKDFLPKTWNHQIWDKFTEESNLKNEKRWRANYLKELFENLKIYHFHDTSDTSPMKKMWDTNDINSLAENGRNLAPFLYHLQEFYPNDFKKIEMNVQAVTPFFQKFELKNTSTKNEIELRWVEKGNDYSFNSHHLSDGSLRFIALATLLGQPNPPKTIIIDEPELGLHPLAIAKLAGMIQNATAKSQIIVSTQSVELINYFEPEDIITVDRKNQESIFTRQSSELLADWLEDYTMGEIWKKNIIGGRL